MPNVIAITLSLFFLLCNSTSFYAQPTVKSQQKYLDSLISLLTPQEYDSLKNILSFGDVTPKKGFFDVSLTLNNGQLATSNRITGEVSYINTPIVNPFLSYTSKIGLGIGYENNTVIHNSKTTVLQHTVSLFYTLQKEQHYGLEIAFNQYFKKESQELNTTLFDFGFSANFKYLKKYIQPIFVLAYDKGTFDEVFINRTFKGATLQSINSIIGIQHQYTLSPKSNENSLLQLVPKIMINSAAMKYKTAFIVPRRRTAGIIYLLNNNLIPRNIDEQFKPQSLGIELELSYYYKSFYLIPNFYMDYGLQKLDSEPSKRVYTIAGITAGFSF